jgi:hypothetical protein
VVARWNELDRDLLALQVFAQVIMKDVIEDSEGRGERCGGVAGGKEIYVRRVGL